MRRALLLLALACDATPTGGYTPRAPTMPGFSEQHARALIANGMKDAKPADYYPFGCSDSDSIFNSVGFVVNGVRGNVCCGLLKGCVVRTQ